MASAVAKEELKSQASKRGSKQHLRTVEKGESMKILENTQEMVHQESATINSDESETDDKVGDGSISISQSAEVSVKQEKGWFKNSAPQSKV